MRLLPVLLSHGVLWLKLMVEGGGDVDVNISHVHSPGRLLLLCAMVAFPVVWVVLKDFGSCSGSSSPLAISVGGGWVGVATTVTNGRV